MGYFLFILFFALSYSTATPHETPQYEDKTPPLESTAYTEEAQSESIETRAEAVTHSSDDIYQVVRAIDGDTIEVLIDGQKKAVRYIGINTPETVHPSKPAECFGKEASDKNKALVEGTYVRLEKDISETDKYGRLLRYVYIGDTMINKALVEGGYAHVSTYPPDVRHTEEFRKAEESARESKSGLWGDTCLGETDVNDIPTNSTITPTSVPTPSSQCTIKGNINADEEKIYHMIGCQSYSKTMINEDAGEQWFCTEKEALDAGWRKALNC